jgi:hypothetical protein
MQDIEVQLVGPPVSVRRAPAGCLWVSSACYRVLAIFIHKVSSFRSKGPFLYVSLFLGLSHPFFLFALTANTKKSWQWISMSNPVSSANFVVISFKFPRSGSI